MFKLKLCEKCFNNLRNEDDDVAIFWIEMCRRSCIQGTYFLFKVENDLENELSILEKKGYIKTHETLDDLIIVLQGLSLEPDLTTNYCINLDEHG